MRHILYVLTVAVTIAVARPAAAQIAQEKYLKYIPLAYPRLVRETQASRQFTLYGDRSDPSYRDVAPKDGIDDARAAWLAVLGARFAPVMVRNSALFPVDFRAFAARPSFALHLDTWNLARDTQTFVEGTSVPLADLAERPCPGTPDSTVADCRLIDILEKFGPTRGPLEPEVAGHAEQERFSVLYFDFPGYDAKTWKQEYWPRKGETRRKELADIARVFMHPFIAETAGAAGSGYELVLQYWFFYPANDGPNDHEGDWEHINVVVSPRSKVERPLAAGEIAPVVAGSVQADGDDPLVVRRLDYYFHHYVYSMDFSSPNAYLPRAEWERQVVAVAKGQHGERWLFDRIRERAWRDEGETRVNTRPIVWIGGDALGVGNVLDMPGLRNQDGHASYPYRGYYKQIGPGTGERVLRDFDWRRYLADPATAPAYIDDYGAASKVVVLPDWERLNDLVLTDAAVRRNWGWFLLPLRYGFPATPSPAAGLVSHADMGNVSVVGPTFNGGWNRTGDAATYSNYEIVRLSWASPLGATDSFIARAGFLNAPILYFMGKPPLDLAWRTLALPGRAALGSRAPSFQSAGAPARRQVSFETGAVITPLSEDFQALFLNRDQFPELVVQLLMALPPDGTKNAKASFTFPTVVAPVYSIVFHLSRRFSAESSLTNYTATVGFDVTAPGMAQPFKYRSRFSQFDYHGNLRYHLLTGSIKPYLKYGSGITWYQLKDSTINGEPMVTPNSPRFRPPGRWWSFGFNETVLGGGLDVMPYKIGRIWLGVKSNYSAIHHELGFEREAAVEYSPTLAQELAGTIASVWRHEIRVLGSVSF